MPCNARAAEPTILPTPGSVTSAAVRWLGAEFQALPVNAPIQYTPPHLAERILAAQASLRGPGQGLR